MVIRQLVSGNIIKATVKEMLVEEVSSIGDDGREATTKESSIRPKRLCPLKNSILLDVISEIITDSSDDSPATTTEVDRFLSEPLLDYKMGDPYTWWRQHNREYGVLSKLALSAPATSVPSERLFSAASNLHDEKRNLAYLKICCLFKTILVLLAHSIAMAS